MASGGKSVAFRIEAGGTEYAIFVDKPKAPRRIPGADGTERPWIVVICMDADDQFTELCKARAEVAKTAELRPLLLVGVGYGAGYGGAKNKRMRDYTPVSDAETEGEATGGADAFLGFLEKKLWPELACRYPVDTRVRGIVGHSLGGLLALHALFGRKAFFNRALVLAPSIWWGDRAVLRTIAERQAKGGRMSAKAWMGVGLKDGKAMRSDLGLLEVQLAARPLRGLAAEFARLPGLTHYSVVPAGFRAGLTALFG